MLRSFIKKLCPKFVLDKYYSFRFFVHRKYSALKNRQLINATYKHYHDVAERIKNSGDRPLRFASYVVFDSTFGAYGLMDLMLSQKDKYECKIVVIPDTCRGVEHLVDQYNKTKAFFINKYGKDVVLDGWHEETGEFLDYSDSFDIIYLANPYDSMVNKVHGVKYLTTKNVLPIYITYCFQPNSYVLTHVMPLLEISLFWKVFTDTEYTLCDYKKYELIKGKNVVLTGYGKMDSLVTFKPEKSDKINIIISPHHTITNKDLPFSNFLKYKDKILSLPEKFPEIHFILRPHPLLFINMINEGFWTRDELNNYIKKLENSGIEYSYGGDYFQLFANSDAMINDCSSYIVEYLYTNKPCCFVVKNPKNKKLFTKLGKECISCWNIANNWNDIESFIQKVIDNSVDTKEQNRKIVLKNVMINYPNASQKILEEISF